MHRFQHWRRCFNHRKNVIVRVISWIIVSWMILNKATEHIVKLKDKLSFYSITCKSEDDENSTYVLLLLYAPVRNYRMWSGYIYNLKSLQLNFIYSIYHLNRQRSMRVFKYEEVLICVLVQGATFFYVNMQKQDVTEDRLLGTFCIFWNQIVWSADVK